MFICKKMMTNKRGHVILDRDGTIIYDRHYLSDPAQVKLLPGAAEGLRHLQELGLGLVIVTNQSGIGRGYFDEVQLALVHRHLIEMLKAEGIELGGIYFCPHTPADHCACRKPKPGLLHQAARDLNLALHNCFVIGDREADIQLGQAVEATTFLVQTGYGSQVAKDKKVYPDYIVDTLQDAAEIIGNLLK